MQHNREREQGCGGRGYGRSADCRRGNNNEERGQMNQQKRCGRSHYRGRGGRSNRPNIKCYSCVKYGHCKKDCYTEKKVEVDVNLVKENETKDEGIPMMTNEGITLDSDMVWYLDTGTSDLMCGHKHLQLIYKK